MDGLRVLLVGDHPLALAEARSGLAGIDGVSVVDAADPGMPGGRDAADAVDTVVMERSLAGPPTAAEIERLARAHPGAPIVTIALHEGHAYRWVQVSRLGAWFRVERAGVGTLHQVLDLDPGQAGSVGALGSAIAV